MDHTSIEMEKYEAYIHRLLDFYSPSREIIFKTTSHVGGFKLESPLLHQERQIARNTLFSRTLYRQTKNAIRVSNQKL